MAGHDGAFDPAGVGDKNALAGVINTTSLRVFLFSPELVWVPALLLAVGAIIGGPGGAWLLRRVPKKILRVLIVIIGIGLTIGLFVTDSGAS